MNISNINSPINHPYKSVFIHSFWRSSSTYFLSRFENPNSLIFDEPFHELIQTNHLQDLDILAKAGGEYIQLHHPKGFKYFQAYYGIENLEQFTNPDNILTDYFGQDKKETSINFIRAVINYSQNQNKLPVFGFTRSPGRTLFFKNNFPDAYNIFLYRDPFDQFMSSVQQLYEYGNFYFLVNYPIILWQNQQLDVVKKFWYDEHEKQPDFSFDGTFESLEKLIRFFSHREIEFYLKAFLLVFLIGGQSAFYGSDLIVDTGTLGSSSGKNFIINKIKQTLNLTCNFDQFYVPKYSRNSEVYRIYIRVMEEVMNLFSYDSLNQQWIAFLLKDTEQNVNNNHDEAIQLLVNTTRQDLLEYKQENSFLKNKLVDLESRKIELQHQLTFTSNFLDDQRHENQRLTQELIQLQNANREKLHHYQEQLTKLQLKISELDAQVRQSKDRIIAMETSKFWLIRKAWFRIRKKLGVQGD